MSASKIWKTSPAALRTVAPCYEETNPESQIGNAAAQACDELATGGAKCARTCAARALLKLESMIKQLAALAAASCLSIGCMASHPTPPPAQASHPPDDRHVYRVDFVVASADPGKPETSSSYTLNIEEQNRGEILVGANVPLTPQGQTRQDVGLKIKVWVKPVGHDLVLADNVEMSSVDEGAPAPVPIHKMTTEGEAVLRDGQPGLVASLEDPLHRRYRITASATLIR